MTRLIYLASVLFGISSLLFSCTTYYIPVDSFKQQFAGMDSSKLKLVTTRNPGGDKVTYKTNPIDIIKCIDGKGYPVDLKNSPTLEIRFTDSSNKRTTFYFDLIRDNETTIWGIQSRFMPSIRKSIPLNTVKKIEIQDDKKSLRYVGQ